MVTFEAVLAYNTRNLATKDELGKVSGKLDTLLSLASGTSAHVQQLDNVQDKLLNHVLPPKQR